MKIQIPEYGEIEISDTQLKREGNHYPKNMDECLSDNFTLINNDTYICTYENRLGLYSFLSEYSFLGSYFYDFQGLYSSGLDFYYWAVDECGDEYLEDVVWFNKALEVLIDAKIIFQSFVDDRKIYILNRIDELINTNRNDILLNRIEEVMAASFEECLNVVTTEDDDITNYDISDWGVSIANKLGITSQT